MLLWLCTDIHHTYWSNCYYGAAALLVYLCDTVLVGVAGAVQGYAPTLPPARVTRMGAFYPIVDKLTIMYLRLV